MAQVQVNLGSAPNAGDGDPARTAFGKVNDNATDAETRLTAQAPGGNDTEMQVKSGTGFAGTGVTWDSTNETVKSTNATNDGNAVIILENTGTNGGTSGIFVTDRDPAGNISAIAGAVVIRQDSDPANSNIYINKGVGTNSDGWCIVRELCGVGAGTQSGNAVATDTSTQNAYVVPAGSLTASGQEFNVTVDTMGLTYTGPETMQIIGLVWRITADKVQAGQADTFEFRILQDSIEIGIPRSKEFTAGTPDTITLGTFVTIDSLPAVFTIETRCTTSGGKTIVISEQTFALG